MRINPNDNYIEKYVLFQLVDFLEFLQKK